MSTEKSPTTLAQEAYAAFGRGDVETIVSMCADDVIWKQIGPDGLATGGTFQGKAAVGQWFANLGAMDDVRQFEPRQFFEGRDIALRWDRIVLPTARPALNSALTGFTCLS